MSDDSVLEEAQWLVLGERQKDYDHPHENFDRIAHLWEPIIGKRLSHREVGWCLLMLKAARDIATPKRDNLVDAAGYALCMELDEEKHGPG